MYGVCPMNVRVADTGLFDCPFRQATTYGVAPAQQADNSASQKLPTAEECISYYENHTGLRLAFEQRHIALHVHEFIRRQIQA